MLKTELCNSSAQIWTCNKFRCGETRLKSSLCSCSDDCLQKKDCCADYKIVCQETCGVHSQYLRPAYPTKTFPNHYTIVTIWLTAMYQGLKAGTYFWPGSDVAINGTYPSIYRVYNRSVTYEERIFTLLKWLDLPKAERPNFYTIYVEEPDSAGHSYGPVSAGVIQALQLVDNTFGLLMEGLKQRNLLNCVNIILLADHGMDQTYCDKLEYMTDYFSSINFYMFEGPAPRIRTRNIPYDFFTFNSEEIVRNLSCRKPDQHFTPYLSPDLPKRLHFAKHVRIDKVNLLVDRQWLAVRSQAYSNCGGGNHGYDNEFKSMEAIFLAHGPSFKQKIEVEPFENIEVYNLLCDLLHIQPAPNNGTHGSLNHLLKVPFYEPSHAEELSKFSVCGFTSPLPTDTLACSCPRLQSNSDVEHVNQMLNLTQDETMWNYFHSVLLVKYAMERNGVNVVSGPIFDYDYDGHFDAPDEIADYAVNTSVPIPTHYFVVLTSCKNQSQTPDACPGWLDVLPFVIPHRPTNVESCPEYKAESLWVEERFNAHTARVRDVELLTGLDFYQDKGQPVSEILQLKTYLPTFETVI
ncbi:hypothetical protein G4228_016566 [Cervus hanglu yarkandensis]|nr:hypothetical protein G4228_016566 [Cervus hanglu yarkandensis]